MLLGSGVGVRFVLVVILVNRCMVVVLLNSVV